MVSLKVLLTASFALVLLKEVYPRQPSRKNQAKNEFSSLRMMFKSSRSTKSEGIKHRELGNSKTDYQQKELDDMRSREVTYSCGKGGKGKGGGGYGNGYEEYFSPCLCGEGYGKPCYTYAKSEETEESSSDGTGKPTEAVTGAPSEALTADVASNSPTDASTDAPTVTPIKALTRGPIQVPTGTPKQAPLTPPTDIPTETTLDANPDLVFPEGLPLNLNDDEDDPSPSNEDLDRGSQSNDDQRDDRSGTTDMFNTINLSGLPNGISELVESSGSNDETR